MTWSGAPREPDDAAHTVPRPSFCKIFGVKRPPGRERSGQVEPVEVHDLVPYGNEVADELLPRVIARVDLCDRPQLGVGPEDQIETAPGPLQLARLPVPALERVLGLGGRLPHRAHVEQVDEEVV